MPSTPTKVQVLAAQRRLSGHLVATPLIGGVEFPGKAQGTDLRLKPEMLQPGGSIWFRGMQNFLLGRFGAAPGLCVDGDWRRVLSAVLAGTQHRLPVEAFVWPPAELLPVRLLAQVAPGGRLSSGDAEAAARFAARTGYLRMPGAEDPEVAAGLATVAIELHEQMPTDCSHVFVAAEFGAALHAGFAAVGRACEVHGIAARDPRTWLQLDFQLLHGLHLDGRDLGVVAAAAAATPGLRGPCTAILGG
jgi:hypothetical protein